MPLYEYECYVCKHHFELIQRVDDARAVRCPKCKGEVRRLLSAPALQFKGSGWYVTDYGKGNGGRTTALAKTEESSAAESSGSSEAKAETKPKPADKAESKARKKASTS
jgi:putative FmdB family regulatory protein